MKTLLITTATGLMLALPLAAQTTTVPATPPATTEPALPGAWAGVTADELKGKSVIGLDDKKIGDVSDVVMGADASVSQIVVDVGGFLGMGAKPVALTPAQVTLTREGDAITLRVAATEDELKALPEYKQ
ncbi:PRC-barrel domain-containing protein [Paenirhodobacter sp.]|uniref:PRC-barrel domain-containing protein n=1 Tax=Paenirhodobacter sp. TaxID=1965326 RepID=UPI003B3CB7A9